LQLENGLDIVCFEYGREHKTRLASLINKDSIQETCPVEIIPGDDSWVSSVTGASYPQVWRINIPEKKIEIVVKSVNRNQEINYGAINYWEGGLSVEAKINGKTVRGQGFAELVGFPRQKKLAAIYQQRFKNEFSKKWDGARKEAKKQLGRFI
jgi:predicted secreted hydrolase